MIFFKLWIESGLIMSRNFKLVCVGASAGGLGVIKTFIHDLPEDFNHAVIIIQHLSPDYESLMAELLKNETTLPVIEVTDNLKIQKNNIYVLTPKHNIEVHGDDIVLIERAQGRQLNLPIDIFFTSAAKEWQSDVIGVILTGTGGDGSKGIIEIKKQGGQVYIQDPGEAPFNGMPLKAIETKSYDFILPVGDIVTDILRDSDEKYQHLLNVQKESNYYGEGIDSILRYIYHQEGIDFSKYKKPTILRRIARTMDEKGMRSFSQYEDYLREHPLQVKELVKEFLIGVTHFFRDPELWSVISHSLIPKLLETKEEDRELRIWVPGVCTGEEAYSLAITILEYSKSKNIRIDFKIFATDLSADYIRLADQGLYPLSQISGVPNEILGTYFFKSGDGYKVNPALRSKIVFSTHNILSDPPFSKMDLTICRNLIIYFIKELQEKVIQSLYFSVKDGGHLIMGPSENLWGMTNSFTEVNSKWKVFQAIPNRYYPKSILDLEFNSQSPSRFESQLVLPPKESKLQPPSIEKPAMSLSKENYLNIISKELGIACLILDHEANIIEAIGPVRQYFEFPEFGFSNNLLSILPELTALEVKVLLEKSKIRTLSINQDLKVQYQDGRLTLINVTIQYISQPEHSHFLIALSPISKNNIANPTQIENLDDADLSEQELLLKSRVLELEKELKETKSNLQTVVEELETTNEELQSTNEELLASNEELQSTNEELQSTNEELHTLNSEYQEKNKELARVNLDMDNLLDSIEIGTLFLDNDLRIRKYTSDIEGFFNLRTQDVGRAIQDFTSTLIPSKLTQLFQYMEEVNQTKEMKKLEIQKSDGTYYLAQIIPYRNLDHFNDGVIVTFIDINELKITSNELKTQAYIFETILDSLFAGFWDWNIQDNTEYLSPTFKKMFGYEDHEMENSPDSWMKIIHPDDLNRVLHNYEQHVQSKGKIPYDNVVRYYHKDGSIVWISCQGTVVEWGEDGQPIRMVGAHMDITEHRSLTDELQKKNKALLDFAYLTSHDLREPIRTIINFTEIFKTDFHEQITDESGQYLDFIEGAAVRIDRMIKGLYEYSKIDGLDQRELCNLDTTLNNVLEGLELLVHDSHLKLTKSELPKLFINPSLIESVFQNLISNAVKFQPPGQVPEITIHCRDNDQGFWEISVADNGIGINPNFFDKIFKIFQRLHSEEEYQGVGIGLASCKKIIEVHNGEIWVESKEGQGTTFYFTLPKN